VINKRFLVSVILAVVTAFAVDVSAQNNRNALLEKGYVGNVGFSVTPVLSIGVDIFTSHGYSFGNGLWVGGGTGFSMINPYDPFLPLFTELKYTFIPKARFSPFLDAKAGFMTNFEDTVMMFNPTIGIDISRFSVFASANLMTIGARTYSIGFYWNFRARKSRP
jgi:hypothetical protein